MYYDKNSFLLSAFNSDGDEDDGVRIRFDIKGTGDGLRPRMISDYKRTLGERKTIKVDSKEVNISLQSIDSQLIVRINGRVAMRVEVDQASFKGRAFSFRNLQPEYGKPKIKFEVSNLETEFIYGRTGNPIFLGEKSRDELLTIPRLQRPLPPGNIIASSNGDLLRGNLKQLGEKNLIFSVGTRDFTFDRNSISNIVWLNEVRDPEAEAAEKKEETPNAQTEKPNFRVHTNFPGRRPASNNFCQASPRATFGNGIGSFGIVPGRNRFDS